MVNSSVRMISSASYKPGKGDMAEADMVLGMEEGVVDTVEGKEEDKVEDTVVDSK